MATTALALKPEDHYKNWKANQSSENLGKVINAYMPDISRNLAIYQQGILNQPLAESEAKKLAIQAIKSFNPKAGASLKTHIVNHMQRLNRITQTRAHAFRMPEELQRQLKTYQDAHHELSESLGREPSAQEISQSLKWPMSKVERLHKQLVHEIPEGVQVYEGVSAAHAPMDDRLLYVYHDLTPRQQLVFEHLTGFGGKPIKKKSEIAKMLGVSPAIVTQESFGIHKKIKEALGLG